MFLLACPHDKFKGVVDSTPPFQNEADKDPSYAIDGRLHNGGLPSFTSDKTVNSWLQLEMECEVDITGFVIVNRVM